MHFSTGWLLLPQRLKGGPLYLAPWLTSAVTSSSPTVLNETPSFQGCCFIVELFFQPFSRVYACIMQCLRVLIFMVHKVGTFKVLNGTSILITVCPHLKNAWQSSFQSPGPYIYFSDPHSEHPYLPHSHRLWPQHISDCSERYCQVSHWLPWGPQIAHNSLVRFGTSADAVWESRVLRST